LEWPEISDQKTREGLHDDRPWLIDSFEEVRRILNRVACASHLPSDRLLQSFRANRGSEGISGMARQRTRTRHIEMEEPHLRTQIQGSTRSIRLAWTEHQEKSAIDTCLLSALTYWKHNSMRWLNILKTSTTILIPR